MTRRYAHLADPIRQDIARRIEDLLRCREDGPRSGDDEADSGTSES